MGIPKGITKEHVLSALAALDAGEPHEFGESTRYDLVHNGRMYPPKAVVGIAAKFATGIPLHPSDFSGGGGGGQANAVLAALGFDIVVKETAGEIFLPGQVYKRRELHAQFGGQRQGGIVTPRDQPMILLITGESGGQYGYTDGFRQDGTFWYTGAGQVGDMEWVRGNLAIRDHHADGKELHLFEDIGSGRLRYVGKAAYVGHHSEVAPDRNGNPRKAIVFELAMETSTHGTSRPEIRKDKPTQKSSLWQMPLGRLRKLAITDVPANAPHATRKASVRKRSDAVKVYVLRRAQGICESCGNSAPFITPGDQPYLEPHHTQRLADDGPDHPRWVGAICPNCHSRIHYGKDGEEVNEQLIARLAAIESV